MLLDGGKKTLVFVRMHETHFLSPANDGEEEEEHDDDEEEDDVEEEESQSAP